MTTLEEPKFFLTTHYSLLITYYLLLITYYLLLITHYSLLLRVFIDSLEHFLALRSQNLEINPVSWLWH